MSQARAPADADMADQATPSGWTVGWTSFAGVMMMIQGMMWVVSGLVALLNDEFFVVSQEYVFRFDATSWGWIHLVLGIVIAAAGSGVMSGAVWARTVGVVIASSAALMAFAWMPWYPVWAAVFLVASGSVIWSLTVHGRDMSRI